MISNNQEFIDAKWFGTVGIVLVQDLFTLEYHTYIKDIHKQNGPKVGLSELSVIENDMLNIMAYGVTFPRDGVEVLFKGIIFDETKTWKENNPELVL